MFVCFEPTSPLKSLKMKKAGTYKAYYLETLNDFHRNPWYSKEGETKDELYHRVRRKLGGDVKEGATISLFEGDVEVERRIIAIAKKIEPWPTTYSPK